MFDAGADQMNFKSGYCVLQHLAGNLSTHLRDACDLRRQGCCFNKLLPLLHQLSPLLQLVLSAVSSFRLVGNGVRQGQFQRFIGKAGLLSGPIPERRSQSVGREVTKAWHTFHDDPASARGHVAVLLN